ncbi:MAG: hypothetical protein AAF125_12930, partial [Chloroflexota bacterium]
MEYFLRIGRDEPGVLLNEVMATITWTRDTKTFSGGKDRMQEMLSVIEQYGGTVEAVAPTVRVQWADAHIEAAARNLREGAWDRATDDIRAALRYPAHVPRGLAKLMLRALPPAAETQLRRALLR